MWRHLKHPNVVPLLGVTVDPPLLVSDWMCGGDLTEYITNHPDADKPSLVRVRFNTLYNAFTPPPVILCRRRPQLSSLLQCDSWRSQGSTRLSMVLFHYYTDTDSVKHLHRPRRLCTDRKLWPCRGYSKHNIDAVHLDRVWTWCTMDCTRDLGRSGDTQ